MSYFRSEEMSLCQLFVKTNTVYTCICALGELGLVQFNNLNSDGLKSVFAPQMQSCADMNRIVRFLEDELQAVGIPVPDMDDEDVPIAPHYKELPDLQTILKSLESELSQAAKNYGVLEAKYRHLLEAKAVLEQADEFFKDSSMVAWSDSLIATLLLDMSYVRGTGSKKGEGPRLGFLTGTIPGETFFTFERILWRVCRGNYYMRHKFIERTTMKSLRKKMVFVVFFQGAAMKDLVQKICQGFQVTLFPCPESARERLTMLEAMEVEVKDFRLVLHQTGHHRRHVLGAVVDDLPFWRAKVRKALAAHHIMNQMDIREGDNYVIAECWMPTADIPLIHQTLYKAAASIDSTVPPVIGRLSRGKRIPPTYIRSNRVLRGFQTLVNSYGIGDYRELNPATYAIVSFPFLFAVMFGDLGHGVLLTIFATCLVAWERALEKLKLRNEIWDFVFAGRYIILGMGLFSMYTGSIYNTVFSKSVNFFGTAWGVPHNVSTSAMLTLNPKENFRNFPYPYGMDPVWNASGEAAIIALNSFKMKLAIILGATQMFFGLMLGAKNHLFFGNFVDLFGECIPQMIFFGLFVYLVALIFVKWTWYSAANAPPYDTHCAPSILIMFIDMLLFKRSEKVPEGCNEFMFGDQFAFQRCLVVIAMFCIPVMLLSKPLYIMARKRRQEKIVLEAQRRVTFTNGKATTADDETSSSTYSTSTYADGRDEVEDEEDLAEVFISQAIRTIEAVLGAVSHTASYLRLWALSLAHDQLCSVLWNMVLRRGLRFTGWMGGPFLCVVFMLWSVLSVAILVVMEGLSAFLHTLRLHWVEFQSKFYSGSGTRFQPFDFKKIIAADDRDE